MGRDPKFGSQNWVSRDTLFGIYLLLTYTIFCKFIKIIILFVSSLVVTM